MNLIWNKNRDSFTARFPSLAQRFSALITEINTEPSIPFWTVQKAKNGSITASENGTLIHSSYNPQRESLQTVQKSNFEDCTTAVFYSCGLGYAPAAYAGLYPDHTLIIIEPDPRYFFAALTLIDWTPVFACSSCIIAPGCPPETAVSLIEQKGIGHCAFFSVPAQTAHARQYFDVLHSLVERNRHKDEINNATLQRFGALWLGNSCANIKQYGVLDGVNIYSGRAAGLPFTVVAAGPSLEEILPYLAEIKKRSVIVCVDTALRACLRAGVEPDFIVIADPQYYAYRHIAGLTAPSSVLITDAAVYPAVYRFPCRKTVLFSSFFPVGQWVEKRLGGKGSLGAGGSVASSAWNFAYLAGSRKIYTTGLDLSFPGRKTHIKGSTFEQSAHAVSFRTSPAESITLPALFSGGAEYGSDYTGAPVLTDARMKMFAWWFESRLAECTDAQTYTFSRKGLAIPGIVYTDIDALLSKPPVYDEKRLFLEKSEKTASSCSHALYKFDTVLREFTENASDLYAAAKKGKSLCEKALSTPPEDSYPAVMAPIISGLAGIDSEIQQNSLKDTASLVFPAVRFEKLEEAARTHPEAFREQISHTLFIYSGLCRVLGKYHTETAD